MQVKVHFNRINMRRNSPQVWSAHTYRACNPSEQILIRYNNKIIGRTVYNPSATQPRAFVEFNGTVSVENGQTIVDIQE